MSCSPLYRSNELTQRRCSSLPARRSATLASDWRTVTRSSDAEQQARIVHDLGALGVTRGDTVLVHASLSSLGRVEGGTETVIAAILQALGDEGTLLMPALSYEFVTPENPVFDVRETPCNVGALPEALMAELEGDRERGLLAALLVEDRTWGDTHSHVAELKRRYHIRHRKHRVRQVTRAIIEAQASGDPALPALEDELRALQRDLQREAEAVRELALARPGLSSHGPTDPQRQAGTP